MWLDIITGYLVFEFIVVAFFALWWVSATGYAFIKENTLPPKYFRWTTFILVALGYSITLTYGVFQLRDSICEDRIILLEKE